MIVNQNFEIVLCLISDIYMVKNKFNLIEHMGNKI